MHDSARRRLDRRLLLVGGLAIAVLAYNLAFWLRLDHLDQLGSDFSAIYVAATVWLHGGPSTTRRSSTHGSSPCSPTGPGPPSHSSPRRSPRCWSRRSPTSVSPPPTGSSLSSSFALLGAAAIVAARSAPWPADRRPGLRAAAVLGALASTGASYALLLLGQWDGVSALGLALAYAAWRRGHEGRAGAC